MNSLRFRVHVSKTAIASVYSIPCVFCHHQLWFSTHACRLFSYAFIAITVLFVPHNASLFVLAKVTRRNDSWLIPYFYIKTCRNFTNDIIIVKSSGFQLYFITGEALRRELSYANRVCARTHRSYEENNAPICEGCCFICKAPVIAEWNLCWISMTCFYMLLI